ncbi:hypothetical protein ACA910_002865 [Epithemia clementina (nom. ined.)]
MEVDNSPRQKRKEKRRPAKQAKVKADDKKTNGTKGTIIMDGNNEPLRLFSPAERHQIIESSCKKQACAIQTCLSRQEFMQDRCQHVIDVYDDCSKRALQNAVASKKQENQGGNQTTGGMTNQVAH